jgi:putative cell wall-binding protein
LVALTLAVPSIALAYTAPDISKVPYERIYGNDQYDTAIAIADRLGSTSEWNNGGQFDGIVLASGNSWEDAIVGAPLAEYKKAPILLVDSSPDMATSQKTLDYMSKHLATDKDIYILGGTVVVPTTFEEKTASMGYTNIHRIGGKDAPETSLLVAQQYPNNMYEVYFAGLNNFGDALSCAADWAYWGYPILLVDDNGLSKDQSDFASKFNIRMAFGNISDTVSLKTEYAGQKNFVTFKGTNVYDTNAKKRTQRHYSDSIVYVVQGEKFMDGLAGAVLAARHKGYIILTDPNSVLPETEVALKDLAYEEHDPVWRGTKSFYPNLVVFGGPGAVSDSVVTSIRQILASNWGEYNDNW